MQTVKFLTAGCKVNQYETQRLREKFLKSGFRELSDGCPADLYVINTCTVTHSADSKSRHAIRSCHRENPMAKIVVTGCYAELDSEKITKIPGVTKVIRNENKYRIPELLNEPNEINDNNGINGHNDEGISSFKGHTRAFLKIQDGCDNFCSYCKVPLVRGVPRSRPLDVIVREAERLVHNGFKEIVLSGICLGRYGKDLTPKISLVDALQALEKIEGLLRLRLSSIEAGDVSDGLIKKISRSQKVCPHLHIPIQSGDDKILRKMNRRYTRADYLDLVDKIRKYIPDIAITTDVLVGFPGETDEYFKNTESLVEKILPLKTHIFPYSRREGTLAAKYSSDELDAKVIRKRIMRLEKVSQECSYAYRKKFLGRNAAILIEGRFNAGCWEGHAGNYIKVAVECRRDINNKIVDVQLKKVYKDFLLADPVI